MSIKDFFIVTIKVIGLYLLLNFLMTNFFSIFLMDDRQVPQGVIVTWILAGTAYLFFTLGIILSAPRIVNLLKMGDGIETEYISFKNINANKLLQLGLIIVGVFLFFNNIYFMISDAAQFLFDKTQSTFSNGNPYFNTNSNYFIQSLVNCIFGVLLATKSKWIANLLHSDSKYPKR